MRPAIHIIFLFILLLLLAGLPYLGYRLYFHSRVPDKTPVQAIPDRTAAIIRINKPLEVLSELNLNNLIWREIRTYPGVRTYLDQVQLIDSMTRQDVRIRNILKEAPLYITLSLHNQTDFGVLLLISVPKEAAITHLSEFLTSTYPGIVRVMESPYGQTSILRVHFENKKTVLYASLIDRILILGFSAELVRKSIDKLSLNTPVSAMAGFPVVAATSGSQVDANVFINYAYFSLATWKLASESYNMNLVRFARYANWSGFDLVLKKDEVIMNGYSTASDSAMHTLSLMEEQPPMPVTIPFMLPSSTEAYLIFTFGRYPLYLNQWQQRLARDRSPESSPGLFSGLNQLLDTSVTSFLDPWMGTQAGRCWIRQSLPDRDLVPITLVQTNNPDLAINSLISLGKISGRSPDSLTYKGFTLYQTSPSDAVSTWLTPLFLPQPSNWFTRYNDILCFASSSKHLMLLIDGIKTGSLSSVEDYSEMAANFSDKANISFYCQTGTLIRSLPDVVNPDIRSLVTPLLDSLIRFQSIGAQIISENPLYNTCIAIRFNPELTQTGPLLWQTNLDTLVAGSPQILPSGANDTLAVLVTDTANTLYKLDLNGKIIWKQKLYSRLLSRIHPVWFPGKDSLFYLLNTDSHLFLIRYDGVLASHFPLRFPVRASNGLALVSTGKGSDGSIPEYQVVIAFRNQMIYAFTFDGKLADGWQTPKTIAEVIRPVDVFGSRLFIMDIQGNVLITDLQGIPSILPSRDFTHSAYTPFFRNRSLPGEAFLSTTPEGKLLFLAENGRSRKVRINRFTPEHRFFYEDLNDDNQPEYIFFDQNTLYYYNSSLKPVYFYSFRQETNPPCVIQKAGDRVFIGFKSKTGTEVYLFDHQGYVQLQPGIRGTTPFDVGTLYEKDHLSLIIGSGNQVRCYSVLKLDLPVKP